MKFGNKTDMGQGLLEVSQYEKFGFDVSNLSTYIRPSRELLIKCISEGSIDQYLNIWDGIKSSEYVNVAYSTDVLSNATCGFVTGSTTPITQAQLSVYPISLDEKFCSSDFNAKSLGLDLKPGSEEGDQEAFIQQFLEYKRKNISKAINKLAFLGSATTAANNYALAQGYLYQLINTSNSASTVTLSSANALTATTTSSNVIDQFDWAMQNIPTDILEEDNIVFFTTTSWFRIFAAAQNRLIKTNLEVVNKETQTLTMQAPGYGNVTIVGTPSMDNNQYGRRLVGSYSRNWLKGVDGGKNDVFRLTFNPFDNFWYFTFRSKVGFQIAVPEHFVML